MNLQACYWRRLRVQSKFKLTPDCLWRWDVAGVEILFQLINMSFHHSCGTIVSLVNVVEEVLHCVDCRTHLTNLQESCFQRFSVWQWKWQYEKNTYLVIDMSIVLCCEPQIMRHYPTVVDGIATCTEKCEIVIHVTVWWISIIVHLCLIIELSRISLATFPVLHACGGQIDSTTWSVDHGHGHRFVGKWVCGDVR